MATTSQFPDIISQLPRAELPVEGATAYISQADSHQIVFMEFSRDLTVPEHAHGAQWGTVVAGEIELTVGGVTRLYRKGESYFIPADTPHSARIWAGYADITFFAEAHRYAVQQSGRHQAVVESIDHLVLTTSDLERTCRFYSEALGMEVVEFGQGRKALRFGRQKINLHEQGNEFSPKAASVVPGSADICLTTRTSLASISAHLQKMGVKIIEGPVARTGATGKIISLYFRDPDGNLLEIANRAEV